MTNNKIWDLPLSISQLFPEYLGWQIQWYLFGFETHDPCIIQGAWEQWSMTVPANL